ncbi:MAG: hypothetical protein P9L96_02490 [Candidatus Gygaella obscura]|nr:hypothetical protein [Candidatus Gygaella obscura]
MNFKKFLKRKKAQAVLEYLIISATVAAIVLIAFANYSEDSFVPKAKNSLTDFYHQARIRINEGFRNPDVAD